jgi:hypothetical protein
VRARADIGLGAVNIELCVNPSIELRASASGATIEKDEMESCQGNEFTVVELKEALRERGLTTGGTKAEAHTTIK